jgi:LuxR family transcriptional regulator of spore coat protein
MAIMYPTTSHLTAREAQVLHLVARGRSAKEVALELCIAPCTVERHIENVRLKTRTRNRAHMVAVVMSDGWLADLNLATIPAIG